MDAQQTQWTLGKIWTIAVNGINDPGAASVYSPNELLFGRFTHFDAQCLVELIQNRSSMESSGYRFKVEGQQAHLYHGQKRLLSLLPQLTVVPEQAKVDYESMRRILVELGAIPATVEIDLPGGGVSTPEDEAALRKLLRQYCENASVDDMDDPAGHPRPH